MIKSFLLLIALSSVYGNLFSQVQRIRLVLPPLEKVEVITDTFTSISLKGLAQADIVEANVNGEAFSLKSSSHGAAGMSNLVIAVEASKNVWLSNEGTDTIKAVLYCYDARERLINSAIDATFKKDCEMPPAIAPQVWRDGLEPPDVKPDSSVVQHLVIHHSATSNAVTDYTRAIRDIYLYHTQGNGWDDIGYNFIIAPNGQLYIGRDGQGIPPDDTKGAHFCGKNDGTMGICLLGTYTDENPTDTMMGTAAQLLSWKLIKENIQPYAQFKHPENQQGANPLSAIAGHRDGCATECPGDKVYAQLPDVRERCVDVMLTCGFPVNQPAVAEINWRVRQNAQGVTIIDETVDPAEYYVYNPSGKLLGSLKLVNGEAYFALPANGVYLVQRVFRGQADVRLLSIR